MILSIAFQNSNLKICADYYKLKYQRFVSNNVRDEAFDVIERLRLISMNIVTHIKQYMASRNISLVNLDFHIDKIKKDYLNRFENEEYIFNIEREKFLDIVRDLFAQYYEEIRLAIINNDLNLNGLSVKLRHTFNRYNLVVSQCLTNFNLFHAIVDEQRKSSIADIIHEKDAVLLSDCYYKSTELNDKFVFVTQDKDILNKSKEIQKILDCNVYISDPLFFINA